MIRCAVIGAGYFADYQLDAWMRLDGVELVAVADLDPERLRRVETNHDVRTFRDAIEMMDEMSPDVVDIATPPSTHHQLAVAAAQRGIHVICQKPLAPTSAEAAALVAAIGEHDIRFMVHENWRWQPWYREIDRLIESGSIGTPYHLSFSMRMGDGWQADAYMARQPYFRTYPRLLLFETGIHFVDTFRFLFGEISTVYAQLRRRNEDIAGEDAAVCLFTFESGVTATLDASRYNESAAADPRHTFGALRLDTSTGHIELDHDGNLTWKALAEPARSIGSFPSGVGFAGDSVLAVQQHFVEQLTAGAPFESEGWDYLESIRAVDALYESSESGQAVNIAR